MLEIRELVKDWGKKRAVDSVSIKVSRGEVVGLLGPNGAGKTTIFYSVMGIIKPTSGEIYLDSEEISRLPVYRRARKGLGYLAQEPSIFRGLTARENLLAVCQFQEKNKKLIGEEVNGILREMGIFHCADIISSNLSGGEKRRVEISRILLMNPSFLLLDEPFVGIDPIAIEDLKRLVTALKNRNIGILITDHNVRDTLKIIDRAYIIHKGRVLVEGCGEDLLASEDARRIYLGRDFEV
ncbi:MAG: LPS export ABC transporter ATP-binding protein [Elusimicrobia bacterium]|nr:LPS export ABC transporter ATP-binding protein [Elusimicrobiota bacterium]